VHGVEEKLPRNLANMMLSYTTGQTYMNFKGLIVSTIITIMFALD
jgi:hypothetical protein